MKTKDAVALVLEREGLSKYRLAKNLDMAGVASVNQWLRGTKMSEKTAEKFASLYNITISDVYEPLSASDTTGGASTTDS